MRLDPYPQLPAADARPQTNGGIHSARDVDYHRKPVKDWDYADVAEWLSSEGFSAFANLIAFEHKVIVIAVIFTSKLSKYN